ncbi:hypothetical protein [Nocardia transvalensis]|uniref:hypothetical protein n=1 Tax=Nocardia transvalensis TaxID=37333 RepID=UPI0018959977|nr:hypothetical protein [Nocardia transvalensis]MBF6333318.1 hypothetical protein [Nocardia transvalensis]
MPVVQPESVLVEIFGVDGSRWIINGPGVDRDAITLATSPKGIYDAPVTTRYKASAFQRGATYLGKRFLKRDITFAVTIHGRDPEDWEDRDAAWREAWDYEPDSWDPDATLTKMQISTDRTTRWLWLALDKSIELESERDPHILRKSVVPMAVTAPQPMWEETPKVTVWETTEASGEGFVEVSNPTDVEMAQKWVVTRGRWTLPDVSWRGKKHHRAPGGPYATRTITLPLLTDVEGGARIDLDPIKLHVRDLHGTNLIGRMGGLHFMHRIPPKTPPTLLPVKVTDAPAGGARVELHQPRLWLRPWGWR